MLGERDIKRAWKMRVCIFLQHGHFTPSPSSLFLFFLSFTHKLGDMYTWMHIALDIPGFQRIIFDSTFFFLIWEFQCLHSIYSESNF